MNSLKGRLTSRWVSLEMMKRLRATSSSLSAAAAAAAEIQIPMRKERGPTDILKALERTIQRDPTAMPYKYHDDPYFTPVSNAQKRQYALSKESGKKAAIWIREQHPELFQHKVADPEIKVFQPQAKYTEKEAVSEKILLEAITDARVKDSCTIYNLLEKKVSLETKDKLFQLLCYYNNTDPLSPALVEERFFRKLDHERQFLSSIRQEVTDLFRELASEESTLVAAHNAMICCHAKQGSTAEVGKLYEHCLSERIPLSVTTYNWMLATSYLMKDGDNERKATILQILRHMADNRVRPNVKTVNAAFRAASKLRNIKDAKEFVSSLYTEFKNIGLTPSLIGYYYILLKFSQHENVKTCMLNIILEELEGKSFEMHDERDMYFFAYAMDVAHNNLHDVELARKVHELLLIGDNYLYAGNSILQGKYYLNYFLALLSGEPLNVFFETYEALVPQIYIPEPALTHEILLRLCDNEELGRDKIPLLWSQIVMYGFLNRVQIVELAMKIMCEKSVPIAESPLHKTYASAAATLWDFIMQKDRRRIMEFGLTGPLMGHILVLFTRGEDFTRALEVIKYLLNESNTVTGTPALEHLNELLHACIERGHAPGAISVIQYAVDSCLDEIPEMAENVKKNIPLTANQEEKLDSLVKSF